MAEASASLASKHHLPFNSEARILANNQKVLEKQLAALDPASVFRLNYHHPDARGLASFLRLEATELAKRFKLHWEISKRRAKAEEERYAQLLDGRLLNESFSEPAGLQPV